MYKKIQSWIKSFHAQEKGERPFIHTQTERAKGEQIGYQLILNSKVVKCYNVNVIEEKMDRTIIL